MRQNKSRHKIAQMFDQIAKTYDRSNRFLSLGQDMKWRRSLNKYLPKRGPLTIVDLACGTGDQIIALDRTNAKVYGIDISKEMLKIAKQKLAGDHSVELFLGSALDIPLDDEIADVVTISFGIRNVADSALCLKEISRILKPGGQVLILEFSQPKNPLIRFFSDYYIQNTVPWLGKKISKQSKPYMYLSDTIQEFTSGESFLELMKASGFINNVESRMNLGTVSLYRGERG